MIETIEVATVNGTSLWTPGGGQGELDALVPGDGPWELEIGFGKGRFLLGRAAAEPGRRFLGIEIASEYFHLAARRLVRRRISNLALVRGEALSLLATALPCGFASAIHIYFPDPWPKSRHHRRRLFAASSVDLIFAALAAGGELAFATDHAEYGAEVRALLERYPAVAVEELPGLWADGPRTNYEAKYVAAGRPIVRLTVRPRGRRELHPEGVEALTVGAASVDLQVGEDGA